MTARTIGYWVATGLVCALFGLSGAGYVAHAEYFANALAGLGYPAYFLTILGAAKLLGTVALLAPGRPLLKEWAYAGFTFDLTGAIASHAFNGDPIAEIVSPSVVLVLCAASYLLRPSERRLPASPTLG
jgi:hypothetical protein